MPTYTVHYTINGQPEVPARMEYQADNREGVFARMERTAGLASAQVYEDELLVATMRRSGTGLWELG